MRTEHKEFDKWDKADFATSVFDRLIEPKDIDRPIFHLDDVRRLFREAHNRVQDYLLEHLAVSEAVLAAASDAELKSYFEEA